MSKVLDAIREKYPVYKDVADDELALKIGQKYPTYLDQDEDLKTLHGNAMTKLGQEVQPKLPMGGQELGTVNLPFTVQKPEAPLSPRDEERKRLAWEKTQIKTEPGGLGTQLSLGAQQMLPDVGAAIYGIGESVTDPGPEGKSFLQRPNPLLGPLAMSSLPYAVLDVVAPKTSEKLSKAMNEFFGKRAASKRADVEALETIGKFTEGPDIAREAVKTAGESLIVAGVGLPMGLPGMAMAAAGQQFGGSYDDIKKGYMAQGLMEGDANSLAFKQSLFEAGITAALTSVFGRTGTEALGKSLVRDILEKNSVKGVLDQSLKKRLTAATVNMLKEMGSEIPEESIETFYQGLTEKMTSNPDMTMQDVLDQTVKAGILAPIAAGMAVSPSLALEAGKAVAAEPGRVKGLQEQRRQVVAPESAADVLTKEEGGARLPRGLEEQVMAAIAEGKTKGKISPKDIPSRQEAAVQRYVKRKAEIDQKLAARRGADLANQFGLEDQGKTTGGRLKFLDPVTGTGWTFAPGQTDEEIRKAIEARRQSYRTGEISAREYQTLRDIITMALHDGKKVNAQNAEEVGKTLPEDYEETTDYSGTRWWIPREEKKQDALDTSATSVLQPVRPPPGEGQQGVPPEGAGTQDDERRRQEALQKAEALKGKPGTPKTEAAKLPPVKEGHVRLYHGEGGAQGAGLGDSWYTPDVNRAASFGPKVSWVDVPKSVADANRRNVSDVVLPSEWIKGAVPFEVPLEQEAIDLEAGEAPEFQPPKSPVFSVPKGESQAVVLQKAQEWNAAKAKADEAFKQWEKSLPENERLVFEDKNLVYAVTKDPSGKWRVTRFSKKDQGPMGHSVYETRLDALRGEVRGLNRIPKMPFQVKPLEDLQQAQKQQADKQAKIAQLKKDLAKEQKKLDRHLNQKRGAWVPPPIRSEITKKISDRMAKIQDEIDALEKAEEGQKPSGRPAVNDVVEHPDFGPVRVMEIYDTGIRFAVMTGAKAGTTVSHGWKRWDEDLGTQPEAKPGFALQPEKEGEGAQEPEAAPEEITPAKAEQLTRFHFQNLKNRDFYSLPSVSQARKALERATTALAEAKEVYSNEKTEDTKDALEDAQQAYDDLRALVAYIEKQEVRLRKKEAGGQVEVPPVQHPLDEILLDEVLAKIKGRVNPDGTWESPVMSKRKLEILTNRAAKLGWFQTGHPTKALNGGKWYARFKKKAETKPAPTETKPGPTATKPAETVEQRGARLGKKFGVEYRWNPSPKKIAFHDPVTGGDYSMPIEFTDEQVGERIAQKREEFKQAEEPTDEAELRDSVLEILDKYDSGDGDVGTIYDVVTMIENLGNLPDALESAVTKFRKEQADDRKMAGRGDMEQAESEFLQTVSDWVNREPNREEQIGRNQIEGLQDKEKIEYGATEDFFEKKIRPSYTTNNDPIPKYSRTFMWNAKLRVMTAGDYGPAFDGAETYALTPQKDYKGKTYTKAELHKRWDANERERGNMTGLVISVRGLNYVLDDPLFFVVPRPGWESRVNPEGEASGTENQRLEELLSSARGMFEQKWKRFQIEDFLLDARKWSPGAVAEIKKTLDDWYSKEAKAPAKPATPEKPAAVVPDAQKRIDRWLASTEKKIKKGSHAKDYESNDDFAWQVALNLARLKTWNVIPSDNLDAAIPYAEQLFQAAVDLAESLDQIDPAKLATALQKRLAWEVKTKSVSEKIPELAKKYFPTEDTQKLSPSEEKPADTKVPAEKTPAEENRELRRERDFLKAVEAVLGKGQEIEIDSQAKDPNDWEYGTPPITQAQLKKIEPLLTANGFHKTAFEKVGRKTRHWFKPSRTKYEIKLARLEAVLEGGLYEPGQEEALKKEIQNLKTIITGVVPKPAEVLDADGIDKLKRYAGTNPEAMLEYLEIYKKFLETNKAAAARGRLNLTAIFSEMPGGQGILDKLAAAAGVPSWNLESASEAQEKDPRLNFPGVSQKASPNAIVIQPRNKQSVPIGKLRTMKASFDPLANSETILRELKDLGVDNDVSMRETWAVTTDFRGNAEFVFSWTPKGMSWMTVQDWIASEGASLGAQGIQTRPEAPGEAKAPELSPAAQKAVQDEISTPPKQKQSDPFDPKAAKVQKKFLMAEIDKAIKAAPEGEPELPVEVKSYKAPDSKEYAEEIEDLMKQNVEIAKRNAAKFGRVTIEVPGDGTFEVWNSKTALQTFKRKAGKFPVTAWKAPTPSKPSTKPWGAAAVKKPTNAGEAAKALEDFLTDDEARIPLLYVASFGDHMVSTDGRRMAIMDVKGPGSGKDPVLLQRGEKAFKPYEGEEEIKYPNYKQVIPETVIPAAKDLDTGRFLQLVRQVHELAVKEEAVRLSLNKDGSIGLRFTDPDSGSFEGNVQPDGLFLGSINYHYLQDAVNLMRKAGHEKFTLSISTAPGGPFTFHAPGIYAIVMPMRTSAQNDETDGLSTRLIERTGGKSEPFAKKFHLKEGEKAVYTGTGNQSTEKQARAWAEQHGYELKLNTAAASVAMPTPEQLAEYTAEERKMLERLMQMGQKWEFTNRQPPGSPEHGISFYTDVGAPIKEIARRHFEKRVEFGLLDSTSTLQDTLDFEGDKAFTEEEYPDIWAMSDEKLERFIKGQEKGRLAEEARRGNYTFDTFSAFQKYMDDRYAERDLEGMMLAFKEASGDFKVQYIKANRKETSDHKKAWIAHLATGAPVPLEDPPKPRTTPRPTARGTPEPPPRQPQPGPPQPREPEPPPTPFESDRPSPYSKVNTTALVQFLRWFGKYPVINKRLRAAYGRYVHGGHEGTGTVPLEDSVELFRWLFGMDPWFAKRVLAHEIGHFVDLGINETGFGEQFPDKFRAKMMPFREFQTIIGSKKELRKEAVGLSTIMRGPFTPQDEYRNRARELFADYMSAMFVDPDMVSRRFPLLHAAFTDLLNKKPAFQEGWNWLQDMVQGKQIVATARKRMDEAADQTAAAALRLDPRTGERRQEANKKRQTWKDFLLGGFVTRWHRAIQAERGADTRGRTEKLIRGTDVIGESLKDYLESSHTWAILQDTLAMDDYRRNVEPLLKQVSDDEQKARRLLNQFNQAARVRLERRAAGIWIEQNPTEARELLEVIVASSARLTQRFGGRISNTPDAGLYDLASEIMAEIHMIGKAFAQRIASMIDGLDLSIKGQAALMAFNVRGKMLNPTGLTVDTAQQVIAEIRNELTRDQWMALFKAAKELRAIFNRTQRAAMDEGLISRQVWDELIGPNQNNYVPFSVLEYFDGRVRGGVIPQSGTAKEVIDTIIAMQLKQSSLNSWRQRQRQVQLVRAMFDRGGAGRAVITKRLRRVSDIDAIRRAHRDDDISRAVIWRDGNPWLIEFRGDPGKTLEKAFDAGSFYEQMEWLGKLGNWTHALMGFYTTLSLPFLIFRNPLRGIRTNIVRTGLLNALKVYGNPRQLYQLSSDAWAYARAAKTGVMSPRVRELVENEAIPVPRLSSTMMRDVGALREMVNLGTVMAYEAERLAKTNRLPGVRGRVRWAAARTWDTAQQFFTFFEAIEKMAAFQLARTRNDRYTLEEGYAIARRAGIPKPGVGGTFSMPMEIFFPWTRVHLQGARADWEYARDPKKRAGFLARFTATELVPRAVRYSIGIALVSKAISWLMGDDEDKDDPVLAEVYKRVSPYKAALDDTVPLILWDPRTGEFHRFKEFKSGSEIPRHYEVISMRLPASEEGRLFGTLFYNMLATVGPKGMEKAGDDWMSAPMDWVKNYLLPGFSPVIETTKNVWEMAGGKNPPNSYTGGPAANSAMFDAGGSDRFKAVLGYVLGEAGMIGNATAVALDWMGYLPPDAVDSVKDRFTTEHRLAFEKDPTGVSRSMFTSDNYSSYRLEKGAEAEEEKVRAKARLVMTPEVRDLYDFYWRNIGRKDKLDAVDYGRLQAGRQFINKVWGSLDDPDSFYNRAAYAATEGSGLNKATVADSMAQAAEPYLAMFRNPDLARFTATLHLSERETVKAEFDAASYQRYETILDAEYTSIRERISKTPGWDELSEEDQNQIRIDGRELARIIAAEKFLEERKTPTR